MMKASRLFNPSLFATPSTFSPALRQSRALSRRTFFTAVKPNIQRQTPAPLRQRAFLFPSNLSRRIRFNSTKPNSKPPNPTAQLGSPEPTSLSQRLKKLFREYGYSAVGVYFLLTALDFPFCFLAVRLLGVDRIGHAEHVVIEAFWSVVRVAIPNAGKKEDDTIVAAIAGPDASAEEKRLVADNEGMWTQEVEDAQKANEGADASLWTQLVLAYAIHKMFIFIRVPVTAAITPKVVKTLRGWGWNIGKRTPKPKPGS